MKKKYLGFLFWILPLAIVLAAELPGSRIYPWSAIKREERDAALKAQRGASSERQRILQNEQARQEAEKLEIERIRLAPESVINLIVVRDDGNFSGSGFVKKILDLPDGSKKMIIVTAAHNMEKGLAMVKFGEGEATVALLVRDIKIHPLFRKIEGFDIAEAVVVVPKDKLEKIGKLPVAASCGESPKEACPATAYGYDPKDLSLKTYEGIIKPTSLDLEFNSDCVLPPGTSGGPVFRGGKVVGICYKAHPTLGFGLFVPIEYLDTVNVRINKDTNKVSALVKKMKEKKITREDVEEVYELKKENLSVDEIVVETGLAEIKVKLILYYLREKKNS